MTTFVLTPEILAAIAGMVLSLAFSYIPGLNTAFAGMTSQQKSLAMLAILAAISLAIFGLSCAAVLAAISCDKQGAIQLVVIFGAAVIANQSTYQISPQTKAVIAAKE